MTGYPTLKWFVNGEMKDYDGGRDSATIISWIRRKTSDAVTKISSASELESFLSSGKTVVVAFVPDGNVCARVLGGGMIVILVAGKKCAAI